MLITPVCIYCTTDVGVPSEFLFGGNSYSYSALLPLSAALVKFTEQVTHNKSIKSQYNHLPVGFDILNHCLFHPFPKMHVCNCIYKHI